MQIRPRDRALLGAVATLAVLAAFYVLALAPQHHRADQLETQITTAKSALATAQGSYSTGRAAQAKLRLTAAQYAAAKTAVPAESNIPDLLRLLERTADAAHVTINSITPGTAAASTAAPAATSATTSGSAGSSSAAPTPTPTATAVPISLTFGGGYQALDRLVRGLDMLVGVSGGRLHAAGPLVGISDVALSQGASTSGSGSQLSISLTATIYQTGGTASATGTTSEGSS